MSEKKHLLLGALFSLLSFFCLSSANALVKLIDGRVDSFQILFLQNTFGFTIIFLIILFNKAKISFYKSERYGLLFLRSIAGLGAFFFVFVSLQYVSVASATLLLNTTPFFIPFILFICFKEAINHRLWLGILPGFIGIAVILNPGSNLFDWHTILPLISGFFVAVIFISLRKLHHHKEPMLRILLYLFLFAALLMLPLGVLKWQTPSFKDAILLALICIATFLSQTTITFGLRYGSPKALAPLCYTSVIFAIIFDWLIWHHIPSWIDALGMLLIIAGGIVALLIELQSTKAQFK
jgi:drug/metabolite transporter (DMT)-like permease